MMSKRERNKGLRGEREVSKAFEQAGFPIRGLEGLGDNLVLCGDGLTLHLETKRRERVRVPEWAQQADLEAPPGTVPVVCWRQNQGRWRADIGLNEFLEILQERSLRQ